MNSRVAVEIMGYCLHDNWTYQGMNHKTCVDCAKIFPIGVPALELVLGSSQRPFTPTTSLDHAKMAWDKLSEEQKCAAFRYLAVNSAHGFNGLGDAAFDPLKLCEAMLAAKCIPTGEETK